NKPLSTTTTASPPITAHSRKAMGLENKKTPASSPASIIWERNDRDSRQQMYKKNMDRHF
ncbi:MAG: hypothetical protein ACPG7E_05285, partial [Marinirhabdus sp.]